MPDLAAPTASSSTEQLERSAEELSDLARELAPATEAERRLPGELVARLRSSGLFRAGAPAAIGAPEAPPAVTLACAETVARGDASAGWCVSIAATSSLLAGWLPAEGVAEAFGDADKVAAGVWAPGGRARRVEGGYRVSGRWSFCSGINHSEHLFGGCMVDADGDGEEPSGRTLGMAKTELEILDTWHTFRAGYPYERLSGIPKEKIVSIEIADGAAEPVVDLANDGCNHRRPPGDGAFRVTEWADAILGTGYCGHVGVENLSEENRRRSLPEQARQNFAAAVRELTPLAGKYEKNCGS